MNWINVVLVNIVIECICLLGNAAGTVNHSSHDDPYGPLFSSDRYPKLGDIPLLNRKVFRGMRVSIMEHPYVVSIRRNYAHYLTGTLLSRNVVISVAHPVAGVPIMELSVVVGENYADRGSTALTVVVLVIHEDFDPFTLVSDISLFRFYEDCHYRSSVKPVLIRSDNNISYVNKLAFVTGWGRCDLTGRELCLPRASIYYQNEEFDPMLRTVTFEIQKSLMQTYCEGYHRHETDVREGMLCLGDAREDNPVSPCLAVPGAPLTVSGTLLGIQSWGFGCGYNHDLPLIYTSIEYYKRYVVPPNEHRDGDLLVTDLDRMLAMLRGNVYDLRDYVNGQRFHLSKRNMYSMIRIMHNRTKKLMRTTSLPKTYQYKSRYPFMRPTFTDNDDVNSDGLTETVIDNTDADEYEGERNTEDKDSADMDDNFDKE